MVLNPWQDIILYRTIYQVIQTIVNYADEDMNGISHFAALQVLDSPDGMWMNYADEDEVDNSVTHSFENAIEIHSVTANDATLSIETVDGEMTISIFPNPTSNTINVVFDKELELSLFNMLGQQVIKLQIRILYFKL